MPHGEKLGALVCQIEPVEQNVSVPCDLRVMFPAREGWDNREQGENENGRLEDCLCLVSTRGGEDDI